MRDNQSILSGIRHEDPWLCAFCGRDNTFLELGCLYGPYWLTEAERMQLPTDLVDQMVASPPKDTPTSPSDMAGDRCQRKRSAGRPRNVVITSALTRSAAAQGRTTVANMGALKMVIKAPKEKTATAAAAPKQRQQELELARVGSNGEVWFHADCVLWAPGTYIQGNGTIGGLGEALQIALDCVGGSVKFCYQFFSFCITMALTFCSDYDAVIGLSPHT